MADPGAARRPVAGIILAGGSSSRLGRPKQLLPLAGRPLLAHTFDNAARSQLDELVVVLGHEAETIRAQVDFAAARARVVVNDRYREGQSTSLHAGLAALSRETAAALFLLGDQPLIGPEIIDAILGAYARTGGPIVMPAYDGRRGNPVLFDRSLWAELEQIAGDQGARGVLRVHAREVVEVPVSGTHYTMDVDSKDDYRQLHSYFAGQPVTE